MFWLTAKLSTEIGLIQEKGQEKYYKISKSLSNR
jgi:hypothetical protein